jgi:acyl-CoA synthetase (AMP-forming)/AMP-acid ligase II
VRLDLDFLHADPEMARARRALLERWHRSGCLTDETLPRAVARAAREDPELPIVLHSSQRPGRLTLRELHARARQLAGALAANGVGRGDVVAIQLPNWEETAIAYVAVALLGAVFVPIVHIYGPRETDWIVRASGARMFICPDRWGSIDYLERIERMPSLDKISVVMVGSELPARAIPWAQLETHAAPEFDAPDLDAAEPLLVVYTSGTTADPKGVVHSHATLIAELRNMPQLPVGQPERVTLQPWPAGHIAGVCALLAPIFTRSRVLMLDRWDPVEAARLIDEHRVDSFSGTPFHVSALLDLKDAARARLDSIRDVVSGGAGVPPALVERAHAAGWRMVRSYGSSEHPTATVSHFGAALPARARTDGSACPHSEIRTVRLDGSDADVDEAGEVWLRGPEQFLGYTDPELNAEAFAADGWFRSGDIGVLDAQGCLTITDRLKDVIIRGGEKISSLEVEDLLQRHPAIADAAALGMPDARYGERVCAFIIPAAGSQAPTLAELQRHFEALGAARQKTPEQVFVVDELPRTPAGKVQKHQLRKGLPRKGEM